MSEINEVRTTHSNFEASEKSAPGKTHDPLSQYRLDPIPNVKDTSLEPKHIDFAQQSNGYASSYIEAARAFDPDKKSTNYEGQPPYDRSSYGDAGEAQKARQKSLDAEHQVDPIAAAFAQGLNERLGIYPAYQQKRPSYEKRERY